MKGDEHIIRYSFYHDSNTNGGEKNANLLLFYYVFIIVLCM